MFRFTIRDVLWLMVVVALAGGWWRDHKYLRWSESGWMRPAVEAVHVLEHSGWSVDWTKPRTEFKNLKSGDAFATEIGRPAVHHPLDTSGEHSGLKSQSRFPPEVERAMLLDGAAKK
jgi:hypothetical protein